MTDRAHYEVVVVGGGPGGLTTGLYTTRLGHRTAVFEREGGRHDAVENIHNLPGVSEDVSGSRLAALGVSQLDEYGADFFPDSVRAVERAGADERGRFRVEAAHGTVLADRVVFATGFTDRNPDIPELERYVGRGLHYCLHCDAYTLGDGDVFVLGHADHAARVAMLMLNFTDAVTLLTDAETPTWSAETAERLAAHPLDRIDAEVVSAFPEDPDAEEPWLGGLAFADGREREFLGGFAVYGREYNASLPAELGCELREDGAVAVDDRGETSVDGVYAVGDVTHGQNQTPIAIGDGARAGIALHKDLRTYPLSIEEIEADDAPAERRVPAAPAELRARMRRDREQTDHAGLDER
ncbi:MAG: NAD(P)/FAD-dependent oxidoreductase [Haloarculaceae archaeon]